MNDDNNIKTIRCTVCGQEFSDKETEGVNCCPSCGTDSVPCSIADDVNIKVNWHELRILVIWAENWAKHTDENYKEQHGKYREPFNHLYTVMVIAQRLQRQFPDKIPVTLFGELKQLRQEYGDKNVTTTIDDDSRLGID